MTGLDVAVIAGLCVGLVAQVVFYVLWVPMMQRHSWTSRWILALNGCLTAVIGLALAPRLGVDASGVEWQVFRLVVLVVLVAGVLIGQVVLLFRARRRLNGGQDDVG